MAMLTRFDLSSDMTAFYVVMFLILLAFVVALARVAPGGRRRGGRGAKRTDDRFASRDGELID